MVDGTLQRVMEWLKNIGPFRAALFVGGFIGVVTIAAILASSLAKPDFALLYSDLESQDSGKIISKLEAMAIPYEIKAEGQQIFVPRQEVAKLRVAMAEAGLPAGGGIGYEIFDKMDAFGTTSFVQDVNLIRALEGELSRTIRAIQGVEAAKVHLVLPKRQLFSKDKQEPSASIMVKAGRGRLTKQQVAAIQHLVAAAVPALNAQKVSIVDDKGTLLARANEDGINYSNLDEVKSSLETRLARTVESLLEKSVGNGKVRAEVAVEMDYDKLTENSEKYDPDGQVIRSTQNVEEGQNSQENKDGQSVSVQNNNPGESTANVQGHKHQANKTEETINYEISKKVTTLIKEGGQLRHLSVAVMVDGLYKKDSDGKEQYTPRTKEELDNFAKLVKSAVGFKADRGDSVEVINMQFAPQEEISGSYVQKWLGLDQTDIMKLAQLLSLLGLGLAVVFFVVRPMMRVKVDAAAVRSIGASGEVPTLPAQRGVDQVESAAVSGVPATTPGLQQTMPHGGSEGNGTLPPIILPSDSLALAEKAKEFVLENPVVSSEVIRGWLKGR
ncbi:MAG: flagellar M-ring protein FliF [Alphaproteobacteria bacterium]|nr:flagellar M-ring protein FliF [Alphaproteobacteria bacterium]